MTCEICGGKEFETIYTGPIRDGVFGSVKNDAELVACNTCGVQRLKEQYCIPDSYYESGEYREHLQQSLNSEKAQTEQDDMQHFTMEALWPESLRTKTVMDVGCGIGSLLDRTKNISHSQIGIEPCTPYRESLNDKGYKIYASLKEAEKEFAEKIDYAFSIQVIEHVQNPKEFLQEILKLLKPGAKALISTPNRKDVLMTLHPEQFKPFFYRVAHRWYFDASSLAKCAELAGFEVSKVNHLHRYGFANTLYWLRDNKPKGRNEMQGIKPVADQFWKGYLEDTQQSDTIYIELRAPTA